MPPPTATADLYSTLQRYQLLLTLGARRLWATMTPEFDQSWLRIAPSLLALTTGAQLAAATAGAAYVPAALAETGQPDEPVAQIRPEAFAGVASDGRSLAGLLNGAVVDAKRSVARGLDGGDALSNAERWLEQALQSAVSDAARDASSAAVIARPQVSWVRVVNAPCCSRCAVLAGKVFAWKADFDRHPQCDCLALPVTVANADSHLIDPTALARQGLIKDLTTDQRARLDNGADLAKVLNESRDRWRTHMAADRRAERYARYTPSERRAAERRAAMRTANGLTVPTGWAAAVAAPPVATVHDFMAHLTSRVDAIRAMRTAGIAG